MTDSAQNNAFHAATGHRGNAATQDSAEDRSKPDFSLLSDDQLKELAADCAAELKQRTTLRKREALEQIRALARAHDLEIEVKAGRRAPRKGSGAPQDGE